MRERAPLLFCLTLTGLLFVPLASGLERNVIRPEVPTGPTFTQAKSTETQATFPDTTGELIRVRLKITEAPEGPLSTILVDTEILAHDGTWATHEATMEIPYPTSYMPPSIPAEVTGTVTGGGTITTPTVTPASHSGEWFIPPHPEKFTTRDLGLKVRVRPTQQSDGTITIETEIENSALGGFVDQGLPVIETRPRAFGKNSKAIPRLENAQRLPLFIDQSETFTFTPSHDSRTIQAQPRDPSPIYSESFAATLAHETLPEWIVTATAETIDVPKSTQKRKPTAGEPQIYLTTRIMEIESNSPTHEGLAALPILTDPQFQLLIRKLNTKRGVDLLSTPSMMLRPGQLGTLEILREFLYPTAYDPPVLPTPSTPDVFPITPATPTFFDQRNTGVALSAAARPAPRGMIDLQIGPATTEFIEFLNFGEPILMDHEGLLGRLTPVVLTENRIEMPVFATRKIGTTVRIPDGATLMCEGPVRENILQIEDRIPVIGKIPGLRKATTRKSTQKTYRHLYIFITPQLVDQAGRRIAE